MLRVENGILRLIAIGASLEETASRLCSEVESRLTEVHCAIFSVDPGGVLHLLAAPSLPETFARFVEGAVLDRRNACADAIHDPDWPFIEPDPANDRSDGGPCALAEVGGFHVCCSSPILDEDGELIGVLALYATVPRCASASERELLTICRELCELTLRRHGRARDSETATNIDALTGLRNRAEFDARLATLRCDKPGAWALFVLDLDNLKQVNDTFGHKAGDALIRAAGERLARAMSPDVAYRLGGDEFAVIIEQPKALRDLKAAATAIFSALETAADCDGQAIVPAASIGGAVVGIGDGGAARVYQNADFALYHVKETGRGGFVRYWPAIGSRIDRRRRVIRDVAVALEDRCIEAFYQPIVQLSTRKIAGVEALCRLRTASGEIMPAGNLRDVASDAKVATELTDHMLAIVAQDMRGWRDEGLPFQQVGVNVSTADFVVGDLLGKLERSFGRWDVPLTQVVLEVSEVASIGRGDKMVARQIERLRARGVQVALDDFGNGPASLTHLLRVPVDEIKIDQSFIANLWPEDRSLAIVQGLIDIARQLDIRVVAEGVESEVQASQLWIMGCAFGQGYDFSIPVDRRAMSDMLRRWGADVDGSISLLSRSAAARATIAQVATRRRATARLHQ